MAAVASLSYNPDGTVATATAPGGGVSTYGYTAHQLTSLTPPPGGSLRPQAFTYDGLGRVATATSGAGMTTTYAYDALDRVTGETHSDATPALVYAYDAGGRLASRSDASGTTTYGYDALNRLTRKTSPGGAALTYIYDAVGNLATATDASGTTTYHYNKLNLVDQLTEPGGRTDVFAYDANHRRSDTWDATNAGVAYDASGNNVIAPTGFALHIRASFDPAGQLSRLRSTRASSDADANRVGDLSYVYAVASPTTCAGATPGRPTAVRQSVTDNVTGAATAYCYDAGARLIRAAAAGGPTYAYGYDANGNRTSGPEGSHSFNAVNQATDASSAYDANGNLTSSTAFPALAYNGVDQNTSVTAAGQGALALAYAGSTNDERTSGGATTYQNGLLGVQTQGTTTCTLIILCTTTTSGFVRDPSGALVAERIGADEYYYAFDGLSSVVALADAAGAQRAAYPYDPYGGHATATAMNGALPANPWRYAAGALDATGLYHFGARYYDPNIGRWTQQDSVVSLGNPANGNRYAYAGDDPVNVVDPGGRGFFDVSFCAGAVFAGCVHFSYDVEDDSFHAGLSGGVGVGVQGSAEYHGGSPEGFSAGFSACAGGDVSACGSVDFPESQDYPTFGGGFGGGAGAFFTGGYTF
jgi:RHS repeat-associated protein